MSNKNYQRGVRFERKRIAFHKRRKAKLVFRTAGSHSLIDVGAIYKVITLSPLTKDSILGRIALEQCEVTARKTRKKKLPFRTGLYWVTFEIVTKVIPNAKRSNKN